jgi:hypothetical protein
MTTDNKVKMEFLRALVAAVCEDSEQTFAELCAEAGIDLDECAELKPEKLA